MHGTGNSSDDDCGDSSDDDYGDTDGESASVVVVLIIL